MKIDIDKKTIEDKIKLVEKHLTRLKAVRDLSRKNFGTGLNFDSTAWNLRGALESTFNICTHILSKIPGVKIDEYKQMAIDMGEEKIVPMPFAKKNLYKMAGYRNRLTHFYFEVGQEEMYNIIQNDLGDFEIFLKHIKKLLK